MAIVFVLRKLIGSHTFKVPCVEIAVTFNSLNDEETHILHISCINLEILIQSDILHLFLLFACK